MDIQTFGQSYNGQKYTDLQPNGYTDKHKIIHTEGKCRTTR